MPAARAVGAANTLWFEDDRLVADNTDAAGFMSHLRACVPDFDARRSPAAVLGAGGAARGMVHAFLEAGAPEVRLFNRTRERADAVARHFGARVKPFDWADRVERSREAGVLVNATSLGMEHVAGPRHAPGPARRGLHRRRSRLRAARHAPARGSTRARPATVDGLGMLLHQAVPGFEKWFGVRPEVTDELRDLLVADIEGR